MTRSSCLLALVLLAAVVLDASGARTSAPPAPRTPAQKVKRLLMDIQESVRKSAEDEDLAFATVDTYGQQLGGSLDNEMQVLKKTKAKLLEAKQKYQAQMKEAKEELTHLDEAVQGSQEIATSYASGTDKVSKKFDGLLISVKALVALLQNGVITPDGTLVTPEQPDEHGQPTKVINAVRHVLTAHASLLLPEYKDVVAAFQQKTKAGKMTTLTEVKMTPRLLARSISALRKVDQGLKNKKTQALGQFESRREKYQSDAAATEANMDAQEGVQAENERKADELSFSVSFTDAVLNKDSAFSKEVQKHAKVKKALVDRIGELREKELNTMQSLDDILDGKYNTETLPGVPAEESTAPAESNSDAEETAAKQREAAAEAHSKWLWSDHPKKGLALLQAGGPLSLLQTSSRPAGQKTSKSLSKQIDEAIHNGQDTHDLLMQLKAQFDSSSGANLDAENVKNVISAMQDVLRSLEGEQSKAAEAKQKCDEQMYRAAEEEQGLKANLALMSASEDHTHAAVKASKSNLMGIGKKIAALQKSSTDFKSIQAQMLRTLEDTTKDRRTILVAVKKAAEVADRALPAEQAPAIVLLKQLYKYFDEHDRLEQKYQRGEKNFQASFVQYVSEYVQLLKDRQSHYEDSLASLELYSDELSFDEDAQAGSLSSSEELRDEDKDLCKDIQGFYASHASQRSKMIENLKSVLPKVPEILSEEPAPEQQDQDQDTDGDADAAVSFLEIFSRNLRR